MADTVIFDFVFHEFWVYGFLGTIFYKDPLVIPGLALVYETTIWSALHLERDTDQQFQWFVYGTVSTVLGVIVGAMTTWAIRAPRLIDIRLFREPMDVGKNTDPRSTGPHALMYWLGALMAMVGFYYVNGDFSNGANTVPTGTATGVGWALIVGGLLVFIFTLAHALHTKYDYQNKRLDAKYTIGLIPLLAAVVIYDYHPNDTMRKFAGLIYIFVTILLYVGLYFYIGIVGWAADPGRSWKWGLYGKRWTARDRFETPSHGYRTLGLMALVHVTTSLTYYIVDKTTDRRVDAPVNALAIVSGVWVVILWILRAFFARSKVAPVRETLDARQSWKEHASVQ